ncbi:MAG TPA: hypothetical protein VNX40_13490, partial [Mucilaginibacter sp.]|nr:hypothetical protein [Mucilaginibacter sp.]
SSYQKNFDHWQNETIEFLKRQSHLKSRDPILIKAQIDGGLKVEIKDTSERMLTRLRLSAVGFFCFKNQVYRQLFLNYLHLYINYLSVHSNDEKYDSSFLDIMRHRDWGEKDINENYSILFNEALKTKESNKLSQVASWATFHPFESLESEKIVLLPMYWPKMHQYLLQANIMLFLNDTLPMKDLRLFQMMKDEETSLLCECPQCYISLEAEVLHKYFKQFKDMDTITNAVPINIVLRKNDDHVEINDVDYLAKVRLPALLRTTDLKDFSQKLLRKYQKMVAANDVISFDLMGNSEHFDNETKKFELYYQKNQAKFKYWLSPDRINDINKDEFQTKLLNLKL